MKWGLLFLKCVVKIKKIKDVFEVMEKCDTQLLRGELEIKIE